ncbi:MAG TPA: hypothetical protein VHP33_03290 [Polyangiaceae bacterium]|nr:hypothetical protein [Polyangiaceae bacterium]
MTDAQRITLQRLQDLHDLQVRTGRPRKAIDTRKRARDFCSVASLDVASCAPWASLQRGERSAEPKPAAPVPLSAPIVASTGPVEVPRYDSLRAWARAQSGSRVICWHDAGRVSLVWIATDLDRKRSQTFASEAEALEVLAADGVRWQAPRKPAKARDRAPMAVARRA